MDAPLWRLIDVTVPGRRRPRLDHVSVEIPAGVTVVVGPSGAGKTTVLRAIAGLMKPDQGQVFLHGEPVRGPRNTVGMAFQNPVLLEWRTILQNVILPLEIVSPRMPRAKKEARARELLALVGHSGSGKTTILRSIAGLWRPSTARVAVDGETWLDSAAGIALPTHRRASFAKVCGNLTQCIEKIAITQAMRGVRAEWRDC